MANQYLIVGAGGLGREVEVWLSHYIRDQESGTFLGFIDDNPNRKMPIYDTITGYQPKGEKLLIAIGSPVVRRTVAEKLMAKGAEFGTLVHPTALVGPRVTIGEGSILCPGAVVTCDATLGKFVICNVHSTVGHDARIGDWCTLNGHCDVTGGAQLGDLVQLGTHACVAPRVTVGDGAMIGAGSVVFLPVKPNTTVLGVPAALLYRNGPEAGSDDW